MSHFHGVWWCVRWWSAVGFSLGGVLLWGATSATAADSAQRRTVERQAQDFVVEAMRCEVFGDSSQRQALLKRANRLAPDLKLAHWQLGMIEIDGKWVRYDQITADSQIGTQANGIPTNGATANEYRRLRSQAAETVDEQWRLARWCATYHMPVERRAHLHQVVRLDPNHAKACRALGYRQVNGRWVDPQELERSRSQAKLRREQLRRWSGPIESIAHRYNLGAPLRRDKAREELLATVNVGTVPAIEVILCRRSERTALLAINALAQIDHFAASRCLARQSVQSPWKSVRSQAVDSLGDRRLEEYVPTLLGMLSNPVRSAMCMIPGKRGQIVYQHAIFEEKEDRNELALFETQYRRRARLDGDGVDTGIRMVRNAIQTATVREGQTAVRNQMSLYANNRVAGVLRATTGQQLPNSPEHWWNWWKEHNEIAIPYEKPTTRLQYSQVSYVTDRSRPNIRAEMERAASRQECLAAGTLVWTRRGLRPIEQIEVGDVVLSRDPETGRNAFKPVLQTTIRKASWLVKLHLPEESISVSGGHLFWASGKGWRRARQLGSGTTLHAIEAASILSGVEEGAFEPSYNLVVEQFHTYFVGQSRILSHDNTMPRMSNMGLPGVERP